MYTYLQERGYYENLYDKMTVADARRGQYYYNDFVARLTKKIQQLDPPDDLSRPGNALLMNIAYMQFLGYELLSRYEQREQTIEGWIDAIVCAISVFLILNSSMNRPVNTAVSLE